MPNTQNVFEYNVLRIACFFGLVRSVIEVSRDLLLPVLEPNFFLDVAFLIVFASTLIALNFHFPFKRILYLFYFPFIVLITIMFIDGMGISYSVENNVFAGIIIIALTIRGKRVIYFIGVFLLCVLIGLAIVEYQYQLTKGFQSLSDNPFSFIFASLGTIAFTLYAKMEFRKKKQELIRGIESLNQRYKELEIKRTELTAQKVALEQLTKQLDLQVISKSKKLKTQRERLESYLSVTFNDLFDNYEQTIALVHALEKENQDDEIIRLIIQSAKKLKAEMNGLRIKITDSVNALD